MQLAVLTYLCAASALLKKFLFFKKKDSVKTNLKFTQLYKKKKKSLYEDDLTYQTYRFDSVLLISNYYFPLLLLCGHIYT